MADGSTDKNQREIFGIVVCYVTPQGDVKEHALDLKYAENRSAEGLLEILLQSLKKEEVNVGGIAAQCYDGANVMSGAHGGMQKLLSDHCKRVIIYIHWFCHRLNLVVKDIISAVPFVADHFSITSEMYDFFKLAEVRALYNGSQLKRLIVTRWSGHLESIEAVDSELIHLLDCSEHCMVLSDVKSENRVRARRLFHQVSDSVFILFNKFLCEYLRTVDIANLTFQSKTGNISNCLSMIDECKNSICDISARYSSEKIDTDLQVLNQRYAMKLDKRPSRKTAAPPQSFKNFFVETRFPHTQSANNKCQELRRTIVELKDLFLSEMDRHFSENNTVSWSTMDALLPQSSDFCEKTALTPLFNYAVTIPNLKSMWSDKSFSVGRLQAECTVFRNVILKHFLRKVIQIFVVSTNF